MFHDIIGAGETYDIVGADGDGGSSGPFFFDIVGANEANELLLYDIVGALPPGALRTAPHAAPPRPAYSASAAHLRAASRNGPHAAPPRPTYPAYVQQPQAYAPYEYGDPTLAWRLAQYQGFQPDYYSTYWDIEG